PDRQRPRRQPEPGTDGPPRLPARPARTGLAQGLEGRRLRHGAARLGPARWRSARVVVGGGPATRGRRRRRPAILALRRTCMKRVLSLAFLLAIVVGSISSPAAAVARADDVPPDYDVPNGHFFPSAPDGSGYLVANQDGIPMWREYQRLGGATWFG